MPGHSGAPEKEHVQLMDQVYRYQRHIYDLTRKYYLLGRDRLVRQLGAKSGESIIEIGCGTARNLIRIAQTYPSVMLYGFDASHEMLLTAEEQVRRHGLSDRIHLAHAMAEDMTPALFGRTEKFDHAIFSYSLSMIPDWPAALRAAANATKPAGRVHIVDFGDLKGTFPLFSKILRAWLRLFHVAPREELLHVLEKIRPNGADYVLHLLPGRYAFVLKATPDAICEIHPNTVAK